MPTSVTPPVFWTSDIISNVYTRDLKVFQQDKEKKFKIKRKDDLYAKVKDKASTEIETNGEKRLKKLFKYLERFDDIGYPRSKHQRLFHKAFTGACIKKILGSDYGAVLEKVIKQYDIQSTTSDVVITCPRRFGKTIGLAQFVAALVLTMDTIEISIYSTAKRASSRLIEKIRDFIILLGGREAIIKFSNNELLEVKGPNGKSSFIGAYPSSVAVSLHNYLCSIVGGLCMVCTNQGHSSNKTCNLFISSFFLWKFHG